METETSAAAPVEFAAASAPVEAATLAPAPAAVETTEAPSTETQAAGEPEDLQDFIKQGLNDIWGNKPAAERGEEPAPSNQVTEAPEVNREPTGGDPDPAIQTAEQPATDTSAEIIAERPVILSDEEIDQQFNRVPKDIRNLAKSYANEARAGRELAEKLGGEHFLAPLTRIAEGIRSGENMGVFEGYLAATGVNGFTNLINDAMDLAINHIAQGEPANEGERELKEQTLVSLDSILQSRFGENASLARIEKLLKYDKEGYLNIDDVDRYYEESDMDENPVIKAKDAEIERLRAELGSRETSESEAKKQNEQIVLEQFATSTNKALNNVLDKMVFAKSAINPLETDGAELKNGKTAAKDLLNSFIQQKMTSSKGYQDLQKSYARGEQNTAAYKSKLTAMVETAMLEAKEMAARLEGAFSASVANTRNNTLLKQMEENDLTKEPAGEPTQTKQADKAQMSDDEYHSWLTQQIAAATAK